MKHSLNFLKCTLQVQEFVIQLEKPMAVTIDYYSLRNVTNIETLKKIFTNCLTRFFNGSAFFFSQWCFGVDAFRLSNWFRNRRAVIGSQLHLTFSHFLAEGRSCDRKNVHLIFFEAATLQNDTLLEMKLVFLRSKSIYYSMRWQQNTFFEKWLAQHRELHFFVQQRRCGTKEVEFLY